MISLTVSDEYANIINGAQVPIVVVDGSGKPLAKLSPIELGVSVAQATPAEHLAEIQRRIAASDGRFRPFRDLLDELQSRFPE